ncbi:MAG: hypothetical protein WKF89_15365 [Chitinophagaceae bacterium]
MENQNSSDRTSGQQDNSSAIFGVSSDAIVQGLHNGEFIDTANMTANPGDAEKIVNEQDQHEIVNPAEEDFTEEPVQNPSADNSIEKQELLSEPVEGDLIDDGIDKEGEIEKGRS